MSNAGGWFRFASAIIGRRDATGVWANLSPAAKAVYPVIGSHVNSKNSQAWPSASTIAQLAGLSRAGVYNAIAALIEAGLIERHPVGGGNPRNTTRYRVLPVHPAGRVDAATRPPDKTAPVHGAGLDPSTPVDMNKKRRTRQAEQGDAAAVHALLAEHGLAEPTLTNVIAEVPGLTPAIARNLCRRARGGENPPGLVVTLLRREGPELIAKAHDRAQAEQQSARERRRKSAKDLSEKQTIEQQRRDVKDLIDAMPPTDLARYRSRAIEDATPIIRRTWQNVNGPMPPGLQAAIAALAKADLTPQDERNQTPYLH